MYTLLMGPLMNVVFVRRFDVLITLQLYIYSSIALHNNSLYSTKTISCPYSANG